jgi:foldase protein PrsA
MKKWITCGCAVLAISLLLTGCGKEIEVKNGSKVAVSTKDEKFTATEYYNKIKEDNIATLIDMIDTTVLEKKYKSTDDEKKYVEDQINQIKTYYGSDENTYQTVLKSYFGVETEKELKTKLQLEYKRQQAVSDYIKENLNENDIKNYYENNISGEIKASHILIAVNVASDASEEEKKTAEEKALKKAQNIIKKLNDGEDFATLAKKNSDDEGTASKGGDLDYFDPADMVVEFSEAAKALKVDEYTKEPVKTQYGYHIILKTGEKEKPKQEEVEDEIREALKEQKLSADSTLFYQTLVSWREQNEISWNDSTLKKAYDDYMNRLIENASK